MFWGLYEADDGSSQTEAGWDQGGSIHMCESLSFRRLYEAAQCIFSNQVTVEAGEAERSDAFRGAYVRNVSCVICFSLLQENYIAQLQRQRHGAHMQRNKITGSRILVSTAAYFRFFFPGNICRKIWGPCYVSPS